MCFNCLRRFDTSFNVGYYSKLMKLIFVSDNCWIFLEIALFTIKFAEGV
jgi:hypothetical protein